MIHVNLRARRDDPRELGRPAAVIVASFAALECDRCELCGTPTTIHVIDGAL
jgi:hypothetical protein